MLRILDIAKEPCSPCNTVRKMRSKGSKAHLGHVSLILRHRPHYMRCYPSSLRLYSTYHTCAGPTSIPMTSSHLKSCLIQALINGCCLDFNCSLRTFVGAQWTFHFSCIEFGNNPAALLRRRRPSGKLPSCKVLTYPSITERSSRSCLRVCVSQYSNGPPVVRLAQARMPRRQPDQPFIV